MTWFRLDDQFHSQPKVITAGNAAVGLYCRLGTYCADKLTDGFVPEAVAKSMGTAKEIKALTTCPIPDTRPLLSVVEGGYLLRDYLQYNPTREKVLAEREAAKSRMQRRRSADVRPNDDRTSATPEPEPLSQRSDSLLLLQEPTGSVAAAAAEAIDLYVAHRAAVTRPHSPDGFTRTVREQTTAQHLAAMNAAAGEGHDARWIAQHILGLTADAVIEAAHTMRETA